MCVQNKKCKEATYRLADYSLRPDFSPLASVTLWKSGEVSMFGSQLQFLVLSCGNSGFVPWVRELLPYQPHQEDQAHPRRM